MIEAVNAGFAYRAKDYVFRNHNFKAEAGRMLAILGPNGRGKTTLLKTVLGLLPLCEGKMRVTGEIGYVPQSAATMFPYRVKDMVLMGRGRHIPLFSSPKKKDFDIALDALAEMGMTDYAERSFLELSGGERQLVLIARALASQCRILILDEPASALDFKNQNTILLTLRKLSREKGLTVIFTTHYPQHAVHIADQVLLMFTANEYLFGPTSQVLINENLNRLYGMEVRNLSFQHGDNLVRTIVPVFSRG